MVQSVSVVKRDRGKVKTTRQHTGFWQQVAQAGKNEYLWVDRLFGGRKHNPHLLLLGCLIVDDFDGSLEQKLYHAHDIAHTETRRQARHIDAHVCTVLLVFVVACTRRSKNSHQCQVQVQVQIADCRLQATERIHLVSCTAGQYAGATASEKRLHVLAYHIMQVRP